MSTIAVEFTAWRGVRFEDNELRLGWLTLWWRAGSMTNELSRLRIALADAAAELRGKP